MLPWRIARVPQVYAASRGSISELNFLAAYRCLVCEFTLAASLSVDGAAAWLWRPTFGSRSLLNPLVQTVYPGVLLELHQLTRRLDLTVSDTSASG